MSARPVAVAMIEGWRRRMGSVVVGALAAAAAAVLLASCGGGSDDEAGGRTNAPAGPPSTAATLTAGTADAAGGAQAAVAAGDAMVEQYGALSGLTALVGGPVGRQAGPNAAGRKGVLTARQLARVDRMRPLAVETAACDDVLDPPCSGSATLDTNIADEATTVRPGDYADVTFTALSGSLFGVGVLLDGRIRVDFLNTVALSGGEFAGASLRLTFDRFSGQVNGWPFGPVTHVADLDIDAHGDGTITADGARFGSLAGVTVTGNGNYTITGGAVRTAYWGGSTTYVDVALQNFGVSANRPTVGSTAIVSAGTGSIHVTVTSSSASVVVYAVSITVAGSTAQFIVTATYPGTGAPSYVAVPAG